VATSLSEEEEREKRIESMATGRRTRKEDRAERRIGEDKE
jgi:hypothetical protein